MTEATVSFMSTGSLGHPFVRWVASMSMHEIARDVCRRHGLTLDQLRSKSRIRPIAHARQEAMWLMRQVLRPDGRKRFSFMQIAGFLDMEDHTTIIHGVKAYEARRDEDLQRWRSIGAAA